MQEDPDKYLLPHCNFSFFKMLNHFDQNLQGSQTLQDLAEGKQKLYKSQDLHCGCLFGVCLLLFIPCSPAGFCGCLQELRAQHRSRAGSSSHCPAGINLCCSANRLCLGKGSLSCSCSTTAGNCLQGWSRDRMAAHCAVLWVTPFQHSFSCSALAAKAWQVSACPNLSEPQNYRAV